MSIKLKKSGADELKHTLKDLGDKISGRLGQNAVRAGARVLAKEAKARAPVGETGALKKSIRVFSFRERQSSFKRTAVVGSDVFYSRFVKMGTAYASARSFLRTAIDTSKDAVVSKMRDNLAQGVQNKITRRGSVADEEI